MPDNPYSEDELKRRAQVGMLNDSPPINGTMPIGGGRGVISPAPSPFQIAPVQGAPPPGWDAGNWADPNMHSVKYDAGRLLYGKSKPSEIGQVVQGADFQKRFPGATFNGKDWLDFNGALSDGDSGSPVNGIDVLQAADQENDTSNGIWWGAPDGAPTPAQGGGGLQRETPAVDLADNSVIDRIMAELQATSNDEQSPAEREALLQMLQGGGL